MKNVTIIERTDSSINKHQVKLGPATLLVDKMDIQEAEMWEARLDRMKVPYILTFEDHSMQLTRRHAIDVNCYYSIYVNKGLLPNT